MFLSFLVFIICSFLHYCSQPWPVDKHISLMFLNIKTVRFLVFIAVYFFISPPTGFNITPGHENLTQLMSSIYTEPDLFYVCVWILRPLVHFVTIFSSCCSICGTERALCFVILLWALPLSWGFHKGHWHKPSCNMVHFCNNLLLYWNVTNCNKKNPQPTLKL